MAQSYKGLLKKDLQKELKKRGFDVDPSLTKADLIANLEADDAENKPEEDDEAGEEADVDEGADEDEEEEEALTPPDDGNVAVAPIVAPENDYLRRYQYRKGVPLGSPGSNPPRGSKAEKMKLALLDQPRVRVMIPRTQGESSSIPLSVTLNGYRLDLPKNVYVEVPQQVAEVIMDSQSQTEEALQAFRVDRSSDVEKALI